jgi:ABC-2 type transport system permease protein
MMPAPSHTRAMLLMARLRLTRLVNQSEVLFMRTLRRPRAGRVATPGKRRNHWLLAVLVALLAGFSFTQMARSALLNLHCQIDAAAACAAAGHQGATRMALEQGAAGLAATPFSLPLVSALTMLLTLALLISVLMALGSRELTQADWDLEWLVTLPVQRKTLLWGRVLERSVSNPPALFALLPLCALLAWYSGLRWSAPLAALLALALLLPLTALLHTLADTGLRMWLPASQLRNLQALTGLAAMPVLYFAMALGMPGAGGLPVAWARAYPAWTVWTPPGLVIQLLQAATPGRAGALAALLLAQVGLLLAGGMGLLRYQLRHGVVAAGARASVRRRTPGAGARTGARAGYRARCAPWAAWLASPIKRRELRLLSRDRNFLAQSLLLPVVIIGSQLLFNGALHDLGQLAAQPTKVAAIAFGIGSYVLMLSAFQTLNNEGPALWMLYTFPHDVESVLREKAQLWGVLALAYPLIVFALAAHFGPGPDWRLAGLLVIVMAGMPIFAMIAMALGVFACDPLAQDLRTRVRPSYVYLYMMLASFYLYCVYTSVWWQKLVVMALCGALALALWQKARDELPYLLDPAAAPPARVSTADGLMAATAFFVLQALIAIVLSDGPRKIGLQALTIAFAAAGATVYGATRLLYWRSKTAGVPAIVRRAGAPAAARLGLACAVPAIAAGLAYLTALRHSAMGPQLLAAAAGHGVGAGWMLALAVLAAPLCEEFIFRGLVFGGLRRSMGALPAMLVSAAIFAIVHPPVSMLPVFVLGLCTAWAYERSRLLLAPMLVHALYNAAVVWWQL